MDSPPLEEQARRINYIRRCQMAEEVKKAEKKTGAMLLKVLLGLVFLVLAAYLLIGRSWWQDTWSLIKGCIGPFLALAAVITFAIAKE